MINIFPKKNDDIKFIGIVSQILNNSILINKPDEVYFVEIDHRFDYKWLAFSHKVLGELGIWREGNLRIPPFVPEKVVEEIYFQLENKKFIQKQAQPLHIRQNSQDNTYRKIKLLSDSAVFLCYSDDTKTNSQANLMFYSVLQNTENYWFVSFINNGNWQIRGTRNISKKEIQNLMESNILVPVW